MKKKGIIPNKEYMNDKYGKNGWGRGSLLNFVIGQGDVLTTPIQVIQIMNFISTNGQTFRPRLNKSNKSIPISLHLKQSTWDFLQKSTFLVVNDSKGTGVNAKTEHGIVRGKTGTAQNPHGDDHSWFSGYIETRSGEKASIVVLIEHGGKGSGEASKISKVLFDSYLELYSE